MLAVQSQVSTTTIKLSVDTGSSAAAYNSSPRLVLAFLFIPLKLTTGCTLAAVADATTV